MCLIPLDNGRRKLAKDLIVYKVLTVQNASWYRLFKYEPNTKYRIHQKLQPSPDGWYWRGFHAYVDAHFVPPSTATRAGRRKVVKMVIPKGTTVVFGTRGDIVSNTIHSGSLLMVKH